MISISKEYDNLGALASSLCLIHCMATPVLFVVQTCTASCCSADTVPVWWQWLDYAFLIISFLAIFQSVRTTSKNWIKWALWMAWVGLLSVIIIERTELLILPNYIIYIPALALVGLHLYNKKYCQCKGEKCGSHNH